MRPLRIYLLSLCLVALGCIYLFTLCPVIYLGDSGELTAAAFCLGVPHGSGYPLYTLFGKLFCLLPIGNAGFKMNLMSAVLGVLTVGLIHSLIYRITKSEIGSFLGAGIFAFIPVFWWQTVAAEVYTLHTFMVALMIWLLRRWDETGEFDLLAIFAFVTGLSFGNHMQTAMLAPAVLTLILWRDRKSLLQPKAFLVLFLLFGAGLLVYGYLPVRTWADAAIHWGDPGTWDRFLAHVTGQSHRGGFFFNLSLQEYVQRTRESAGSIWSQFGVMVLVGVWGWATLGSSLWRVFFLLVVAFDVFYTIFFNTVSLEITPFNLSTATVLAISIGCGVHDLVKRCERSRRVGKVAGRVFQAAWSIVPLMYMILNYTLSDQSRNYIAHEHGQNILRTTDRRDILFIDGDNNFFPLVYGRLVERMREDLELYDRFDLVFKTPYVGDHDRVLSGDWKAYRSVIEEEIIVRAQSRRVFYVLFNPYSVTMPEGFKLIPYCILYRVVGADELDEPYRIQNTWKYYSQESFFDPIQRDFMNRQVASIFHFRLGQHHFLSNNQDKGLKFIGEALRIGQGDSDLYSAIAGFLMDHGLLEESRKVMEDIPVLQRDREIVHFNWGRYYLMIEDYGKAQRRFESVLAFDPGNPVHLKNYGIALYRGGKMLEAERALTKSLEISPGQKDVEALIQSIAESKSEEP